MLILLMLLILGAELNVSAPYWIFWGVAFMIESVKLLRSV